MAPLGCFAHVASYLLLLLALLPMILIGWGQGWALIRLSLAGQGWWQRLVALGKRLTGRN
jgi:hypothetical protein